MRNITCFVIALFFASCASVKEKEAFAKKDIYLGLVKRLEKLYPADTLTFYKDVFDSKYYYKKTASDGNDARLIEDSFLVSQMKVNKIWSIDAVPQDKVVLEFVSSPFAQKRKFVTYYYKMPEANPDGTAIAPNLYYKEMKAN